MDDDLTLSFYRERATLRVTWMPEDSQPAFGEIPAFCGGMVYEDGPLELNYRFLWYGYDLEQFRTRLVALHGAMAGEATFANQEQSIELRLFIPDPGRGRVCSDIRIEHLDVVEDQLRSTHYHFDGMDWADQSHLPGLIREIQALITTWGMDIRHPLWPEAE